MVSNETAQRMERLLKQREYQSTQIAEINLGLRELKQRQAALTQLDQNAEHMEKLKEAVAGLTTWIGQKDKRPDETAVVLQQVRQATARLIERLDAFTLKLQATLAKNGSISA